MSKFMRKKATAVLAAGSLMAGGLVLAAVAPAATAAVPTSGAAAGTSSSAFAVPGPVTNLRVTPRQGAGFDIYFDRVQDPNGGSIRFYRIEVRDADGALVGSQDYSDPFGNPGTSAFGIPTGVPLDVSVAAWNNEGGGEVTTVRDVVPSSPPYTFDVVPTPGDRSMTLRWNVSEPQGPDVKVTGFTIRGGGGNEVALPASARSKTIDGLRNGRRYKFSIAAETNVGEGSRTSFTVTPAGLPGRPRDVRAATQGRTIVVRWSTATMANGSPIKTYRVAVAGKTVTVKSKFDFAKIRNVRPGSYRATIRAINGVGAGATARTNTVRVGK